MYLAILQQWEGYFRRYADGTDTGECSTKDFICMVFSLLSWECKEK